MKKTEPASAFAYPPVSSGTTVSVREAKAHFSALVDRAAAGEEITISWHGQARARLTAMRPAAVPLRVNRDWLFSMPVGTNSSRAESLVRADRDGKG